MGQFGTYVGLFWVNLNLILGRIASFCLASTLFGLFWLILGHFLARFRSPFGSFWVVLACFRSRFGSFSLVSGCFVSF